jgi:hypothetical protein
MSGHADPPDGTPDSGPGGGDDEYRSVVFDESFVRAARIQEYSARERLDGAARAVRVRHALPRGLARQAVALILLIVVAFGFAVYMGVRHPYRSDDSAPGAPFRASVIPLVPTGSVPAVSAVSPFAGSLAETYDTGAEGITAENPHRIGGFSQTEVDEAYALAKEYLTLSALDPNTVFKGDLGAVRDLLAPGQLDQFDSSLARPAADGLHEATGWLVRFDPAARVRPVGGQIRVKGSLQAAESTDSRLEITADHTFVYALRGPVSADGVSLFTVRRRLLFRFDHRDLRQHHIEVAQAAVAAGPLPCSPPVEGFRPILAGHTAPGPVAGADPFDRGHPVDAVCAPLSTAALTPSGLPAPPAPGPDRSPGTLRTAADARPSSSRPSR